MILKHWLKDLKSSRPNTRARKAAQRKSPWKAEAVEQRLLLSGTNSAYGADVEVQFTESTGFLPQGQGGSGNNKPDFFRTLGEGRNNAPAGGPFATFVLNWDTFKNTPPANFPDMDGKPKNTRITIDETVPHDPANAREVMRIINLPSGWTAKWSKVENNRVVEKGEEQVGGDRQVGRDFGIDQYGTSQFKTRLFNANGKFQHSFEWRRLTTSNVTGGAQRQEGAEVNQTVFVPVEIKNTGNLDYRNEAGVIEYYTSTSSVPNWNSQSGFQTQSMPNRVPKGAMVTETIPVQFTQAGRHYLHWRINTNEAPDWSTSAEELGEGSGASVEERDSFANRNFAPNYILAQEPDTDNRKTHPTIIDVVGCPDITAPTQLVVNEGDPAIAYGTVSGTFGAVTSNPSGIALQGNRWSLRLPSVDGPADSRSVTVSTTGSCGGDSETFSLVVNNVAPTMNIDPVEAIVENGIVQLTGTYFDPGVLDTHSISIDWGDESSILNSGVSGGSFHFTHQYLDDGPSPGNGTPEDVYTVTVILTDSDGAPVTQVIPVTVTNADPVVGFHVTRQVDENGVATLSGTITDVGSLDAFTLMIDWGDGNTTTESFAAGTTTFRSTHQYLDDGPSPGNGTLEDDFTVTVTVTDDDGGETSAGKTVTVANVAPVLNGVPMYSEPAYLVTGTNDILGLEVADIDRDGDLDLATASRLDNQVAWYSNDGSGNFTKFSLQALDDVIEIKAGDFDGDGDIDLVSGAVDGRQIRLYENDGNENFSARTLVSGFRPNQLVVTDLDDDSDLDIVWGTQDGTAGWVENLGAAGVTKHVLLTGLGVTREVAVADVNQDGKKDLLVSSRAISASSPSGVQLLINNGDTTFNRNNLKTDVGVVFADINSLDIDSDGDIDIVATNESDDQLLVFTNANGVFSESTFATQLDGPQIIHVIDQNDDGYQDLLISGVLSDSVALFRNDGLGNLTEYSIASGIDGARNILVGDLNGNGMDDVIVDARFGDGVVSFEYTGEQLPKLTAITEGQTATLSATYFDEGTLDQHTVDIDWGDGTIETAIMVSGGSFELTHQYQDDNDVDQYAINVTLRDDDGGEVSAFTTVAVSNVDPVAEIVTVSEPRLEGSEITVTAQATDAAGTADTLTYSYEVFSDGGAVAVASGSGVDLTTFQFTPADDGDYQIVLTVTDEDGGVSEVSRTVAVGNVGPMIELGEDCIVHEGDTVSLDLTSITDPGDDTISGIEVDWGDGTSSTFTSPQIAEHIYEDGPGDFTISVTLIDEDGTWTSASQNSVSDYEDTIGSLSSTLFARYELDGDVVDSAGSADGGTVGSPTFSPGLVGDSLIASNGNYGWVQPGTSFVPGDDTFSTSMHFNLEAMSTPLNWAPLIVTQTSDFSEGALFAVATTNELGDTLWLVLHGGPKGSSDFQVVRFVAEESLLGCWHQTGYSVDRDNGVVNLYLDGEQVASEALTVSSMDSTKGLFIGQYDFTFGRNGHPRFVGGNDMQLDDVLLFDTALTEDQYEQLTLSGSDPFKKMVTVVNADPVIAEVNAPVIDEDGTAVVTGSFTDVGTLDTHVVDITWGDGTTTPAVVDPVSRTFTAEHQYLDDDPTATASDIYDVSVTVTDDDGGSDSADTTVTVNNVAPVTAEVNAPVIDEDGTAVVTGSFTDAGTLDTHVVDITWGDGTTTPAVVDPVSRTFTAEHQYLDDDPTATAGDIYNVSVTVTDDDGGSDSAETTVTVNNVAPVIAEVNAPVIDEDGTAVVTGSFTDVGTLDTHVVDITWGDGTTTPAVVDPVSRTFTAEHQYLDDDPTATASDIYHVSVTVTDDDGGSDSADTTVTVNNVAPEFTEITSSHSEFCSASEDGLVTIDGTFFDVGTQDTHSITIDWGDGSPVEPVTSLDQTTDEFTASHQYLNGGLYTVTVMLTDDDGGTVTHTATATTQGIGIVDGTLYIVGTDGKDSVRLREHRGTIQADVKLDGVWRGWGWFGRYVYQSQSHTRYDAADVTEVFVSLCDGDDHADIWVNSATPVTVHGGGGDDCIYTAGADDTILGGSGNDWIKSYSGNDFIDGGSGNNRIWSGDGDDTIIAGDGHDWISAGDGDDTIDAGDGNNTVYGGFGNDIITAGLGHDCLDGGCGDDDISSGGGDDHIFGGEGDDVIDSGDGDDCVFAGSGNDTVDAGTGDDWIEGGSGDDVIFAGDGDDFVTAGSGDDVIVGGDGDDRLNGGRGSDILIGGTGADRLNGGRGNDLLIAGSTIYDDDEDALQSIFAEWTSNASYMDRIDHLQTGGGSHLNGIHLNAGTTVLGDSDRDILKGNWGRDAFFAASTDNVRDRKRDEFWEFLTDV